MPQAQPLLLVFYAALLATAVSGALSPPPAPSPPKPKNCPAKCGNIDIPYPFGVGPGCSLSHGFALTCHETTSPPSLHTGNVKIANITLETAQMEVYTFLTYSCTVPLTQNMALNVSSPLLISPSANVFTGVGCDLTARLQGQSGGAYLTGCITSYAWVNDAGDDGSPCTGQGCCQASLTPNLTQVSVRWNNEQRNNPVPDNPCQYAFVAKKG